MDALEYNGALPPEPVMAEAFYARDGSYDGLFVAGVSTTGIFCRPSCPARKPRRQHLSFFAGPEDALREGYRPCMRCRPMHLTSEPPEWLAPLLEAVELDPIRRWTDADIRRRGVSPERVRRWFKRHHGITFHAYSRARRLGSALGAMRSGDTVTTAAFDTGYDSLSGFNEAFKRYFGSAPTDVEASSVVRVDRISTPLGPMLLGATERELVLLEFTDRRALESQVRRIRTRFSRGFVPGTNDLGRRAAGQVAEYFEGRRREFDLPIAVAGSAFQQEVWDALRQIPYGETRSYGEVAERIGRPKAVRAVGTANGANALAIVIPCHRVVGSDGKLVGYGGGLWRKKRLLELERSRSGSE